MIIARSPAAAAQAAQAITAINEERPKPIINSLRADPLENEEAGL